MKKIDIHCHTTNRKLHDIVPKSASIDTLLSEMKKYDVEKTVLLATYFPHRSSGISNFRLLHWIGSRKEFFMFGSLDFEHYFNQGYNELEELAKGRLIKGIKIYMTYQDIDLQSDKMGRILSLAKTHNLVMMFHTGESHTAMKDYGRVAITRPVRPREFEFIPENIPVILSHMAKPYLDELIRISKRKTNIYTDMSGVLDSYCETEDIKKHVEDIKKFLGECGPEKLLFGTDFPVQTHEHSILMVEEGMKNYSNQEKKLVYYENAGRLLR